MPNIRLGIVGVGNCASSLLQGIEYYRDGEGPRQSASGGLMHLDLAGYRPGDIQIVCAFDIDERNVGKPIAEAAVAHPNNTMRFVFELRDHSVRVEMGPLLDGVPIGGLLDVHPRRGRGPLSRGDRAITMTGCRGAGPGYTRA